MKCLVRFLDDHLDVNLEGYMIYNDANEFEDAFIEFVERFYEIPNPLKVDWDNYTNFNLAIGLDEEIHYDTLSDFKEHFIISYIHDSFADQLETKIGVVFGYFPF